MAHAIATGNDFAGHKVFNAGAVLYVCGEGQGALSRRIKALVLAKGGFDDNFLMLNEAVDISNFADIQKLKNVVDNVKPALVIIDTFSSCNGGINENDNSEVGRALKALKDAVSNGFTSSLIIHHSGKDETRGARGAIVFKNNVDYMMEAKRGDNTMQTVLTCQKMKDGEHFSSIAFDAEIVELGLINQNGTQATSLILRHTNEPVQKQQNKPLDTTALNILTALHEAIAERGIETPQAIKKRFKDSPQNSPKKVVHIDDFRCYAYPFLNVSENSKRNTLKRQIEKLEKFSKAMFYNDYLW
jgi:hypothetical protein